MNYRSQEELDKIAADLAIEELNKKHAEEAMAMIEEGLMKLGELVLINNDVDVNEKVASGEVDEEALMEFGVNAYTMIKEAKADEAWEEMDKEAHDVYHAAWQLGFEDTIKEAGLEDFFFTEG